MSCFVVVLKATLIASALDASMSRNELDEGDLIRRQERLATAFRAHMTEGQKFKKTGRYRQEFFEEVIDRANDVSFILVRGMTWLMRFRKLEHVQKEAEKKESSSSCLSRPQIEVQQAGEKLIDFIFPSKGSCYENGLRRPLVILAFDEAHQLANPMSYYEPWTLLSELRRVLRELNEMPIFSLFLSTSPSKFRPYDIKDLRPITHTSFDALAYIAEEGVTTIDEVADEKWMSHLGRPLFASLSHAVS